jgi:hypothetical protein
MPRTVIAPDFDPTQKAGMTFSMSCVEWDELGAALAGMQGKLFQTTADAILQGLVKVGYYEIKD